MSYKNAVLFSKRGNQQELALLGSRAIITLSALWREILSARWREDLHRNPWIEGEFVAVRRKVGLSDFRLEEIASDTGYRLSRFKGTQGIEVVGKSYELPREEQYESHKWGMKKPDIAALCAGKKPAFVTFDQAGYDNSRLFAQGMAVAAELVVSGYYGAINCYSGCIDNEMYNNPERCVISNEEELLRVRIHWGNEVLVGSLLDLCRAEGFLEEEGWEAYERPSKIA